MTSGGRHSDDGDVQPHWQFISSDSYFGGNLSLSDIAASHPTTVNTEWPLSWSSKFLHTEPSAIASNLMADCGGVGGGGCLPFQFPQNNFKCVIIRPNLTISAIFPSKISPAHFVPPNILILVPPLLADAIIKCFWAKNSLPYNVMICVRFQIILVEVCAAICTILSNIIYIFKLWT